MNYDDIINLPHHVSKKHKPMSMYNRAAQFSPFAALTGYGDLVDETGRETGSKIELDEYEKLDLNNIIQYLIENKNVKANFTYFLKDKYKSGGEYLTISTFLKKIDEENKLLITSDGQEINVEDILKIEIQGDD